MSRMDIGNMRNTIIEMAASLIHIKAQEHRLIAKMRQERYGEEDETAANLLAEAKRMDDAIELMDQLAGCWS